MGQVGRGLCYTQRIREKKSGRGGCVTEVKGWDKWSRGLCY